MKMIMKELFQNSIELCEIIYKLVNEKHLNNSQEFLDWQDKLNELSVRLN